MRNLITTSILTLTIFQSVFCQIPKDQSGKVVYSEVIELDSSFASEVIYKTLKEWFSVNPQTFNRSNSDKNVNAGTLFGVNQKGNSALVDDYWKNDNPLKLSEENEKLIGRVVMKYTGANFGCIRLIYMQFDLKISIKAARLKYEITNFNYTNYNQATMQTVQLYGMRDEGNCSSKNTLENLMLCDKCPNDFAQYYSYLNTDVRSLIAEMKKYLAENKVGNDDW